MDRYKTLSDPPESDPKDDNEASQEEHEKDMHEDVGLNHDEADDLSLNKPADDEVL